MVLSLRSRIPVAVLVVLGLVACGGKTVGGPGGNGEGTGSSGGSSGSGGSGGSGSGSTGGGSSTGGSSTGGGSSGSGECVDVSASSFSAACVRDSDCTLVTTGQVCTGSCDCGDTPINQSSLAAYDAATAGITFSECPCPYSGAPRCIADQCTVCPPEDPTCADAGTTTIDASTGDAGSGDDGGVCVYVDPTSFSKACVKASDCVMVTTGELCSGSCDCGNTPISASAESQWQEDVAGIQFAACPCFAPPPPACVNDLCVVLPP
jgi:hypothetical protein